MSVNRNAFLIAIVICISSCSNAAAQNALDKKVCIELSLVHHHDSTNAGKVYLGLSIRLKTIANVAVRQNSYFFENEIRYYKKSNNGQYINLIHPDKLLNDSLSIIQQRTWSDQKAMVDFVFSPYFNSYFDTTSVLTETEFNWKIRRSRIESEYREAKHIQEPNLGLFEQLGVYHEVINLNFILKEKGEYKISLQLPEELNNIYSKKYIYKDYKLIDSKSIKSNEIIFYNY
jgi:hypothetical protein